MLIALLVCASACKQSDPALRIAEEPSRPDELETDDSSTPRDPAQVPLMADGLRWGLEQAEVDELLGESSAADEVTAKVEQQVAAHRRVADVRFGDWRGAAVLGFFRGRLAQLRVTLPDAEPQQVRAALVAAGLACDAECTGDDHRVSLRPAGAGGVEVALASEREGAPWRELRGELRYSRESLREVAGLSEDTVLFDFDGDGDDDVAILRWPRVDVLIAGDDGLEPRRFQPCEQWPEIASESLIGYWIDGGRLVLHTSGPGPSGMTFVEVADAEQVSGDGCHSFGCVGMGEGDEPVAIGGHRYGCGVDDCLSERGDGSCADELRRPRRADAIVDDWLHQL